MKKIVLTFGLVSGVVMSAMMVLTLPLHDRIDSSTGMIIGYTTMVAASLSIYFGVRRYRDEQPGGTVSFGRAFAVGLLIACVAGACYTATWEVIYFRYQPDYIEKYQARQLDQERARGTSPAELERKRAEMTKFAQMYHNPAFNAAMTFMEPLPVGLLGALISAGLLRRRRPGLAPATVAMEGS